MPGPRFVSPDCRYYCNEDQFYCLNVCEGPAAHREIVENLAAALPNNALALPVLGELNRAIRVMCLTISG